MCYDAPVNIEAALQEAEAELTEARKAVERIPQLETEVRGLRLALARQRGEPTLSFSVLVQDEAEDREPNWLTMSRAKAILRLLADSKVPMSPAELSERMAEHGRPNDSPHYVSAVLARLKKTKKVRSLGYGKWVITKSALSALTDEGNR